MKIVIKAISGLMIGLLMGSVFAADGDDESMEQFQALLLAIDDRSFETIQKAIDKTDMRNRVLSAGQIDENVAQAFNADFWQVVESAFSENLPAPGSKVSTKLVDFAFEDGAGKAAIRYTRPNFEYFYQVYDIRHDGRGRLKIIDWFNSRSGQMFSAEIAEELMIQMPTKAATRRTISIENPTDLQLFQVTEIYKASRDMQPPRFFEIYDEFNDALKSEPFIAKYAVYMAFLLQDADRLRPALETFVQVYSDQPNYGLTTSDFYLAMGALEEAYALLKIFKQNFAVKEGALPAKLSALALAIGKLDDAETFAVEATSDEPSLELGWWSLLRVRSSVGDYEGAIEALTALEETFDHRLDEAKLRRDKHQGFVELVASQEFKEWRAARP